MSDRNLWIRSGIGGIFAVICYILAITMPWPKTQFGLSLSLIIVSAWPIFSIIYCYGLYTYIAAERQGTANRLAFIFTITAFTTVLAMVIVQLSVGASITEITKELDEQTTRALHRGLRMIDLGLDIAWDMLLGTALIFLGIAMRKRTGLGPWWAIPAIVLGCATVILNAATFPWPPADRGLIDIGPIIGLYITVLAVRFVMLGYREPK